MEYSNLSNSKKQIPMTTLEKNATKLVGFQKLNNDDPPERSQSDSGFSYNNDDKLESFLSSSMLENEIEMSPDSHQSSSVFENEIEMSSESHHSSAKLSNNVDVKSKCITGLTLVDLLQNTNISDTTYHSLNLLEIESLKQNNVISQYFVSTLPDRSKVLPCYRLDGVLKHPCGLVEKVVSQLVIDDIGVEKLLQTKKDKKLQQPKKSKKAKKLQQNESQSKNQNEKNNEKIEKLKLKFPDIDFTMLRIALLFAMENPNEYFQVSKLSIKTTFINRFWNNGDKYDLYNSYNSNLPIYVELSKNQYYKLLKPLHKLSTLLGESDSFVYQHNYIKKILSSGQFFQNSLDQFLFCYKSDDEIIYLLVYIDEVLIFGNPQPVIKLLQDNSVWCGECGKINGDQIQQFLNFTIKKSNNKFWLSQQDFIEYLNRKYPNIPSSTENKVEYPINGIELKTNLPYLKDFNWRINELKYIVNGTRPDLYSSIDDLESNQANTSENIQQKKIEKYFSVLKYLVENKTKSFCLRRFTESLTVFVDCYIDNNIIKVAMLVQWLGTSILWKIISKKVDKSSSLDNLKIYAAIEGVAEGYKIAQLIGKFCHRYTPPDLHLSNRSHLSQNPPYPPAQSNLPKFTLIWEQIENFELDKIAPDSFLELDPLNYIKGFYSLKYFIFQNEQKTNLATDLLSRSTQ